MDWQENRAQGEYQLTPEAMGQRRLKNVCLSSLLAAEVPDQADVGLALQQYQDSSNMTDVMAVLGALSHCDIPERQELLDDFYEKWKNDVLVMDKWLILQATSSLPTSLASVQKLMDHPAFSIANPNKVRSLIGAFGGNQNHAINKRGKDMLKIMIVHIHLNTGHCLAGRLFLF